MRYIILILLFSCTKNNDIKTVPKTSFHLKDTSHVIIDGYTFTDSFPIVIENSSFITIKNCRFKGNYIAIHGKISQPYQSIEHSQKVKGIDSLTIINNTFDSIHHNAIMIDGLWPGQQHSRVLIKGNTITNTRGVTNEKNSGNGILLMYTDNFLIEGNTADNNGWQQGHGHYAIWGYRSINGTFRGNKVTNTRLIYGNDGGAYDADGGSQNIVFENNYSSNNDGPAYLAYEDQPWLDLWNKSIMIGNITIRNNVSINDGNKYYATVCAGGDNVNWHGLKIHHNHFTGNVIFKNFGFPIGGVEWKGNVLNGDTSGIYNSN